MRHQLEPLGLASGNRGRRLAQSQIPEPHLHHQSQGPGDQGMAVEQFQGLLGGQSQHIRYGVTLVGHIEQLLLEAMSAALIAGHGDWRQELQLNLLGSGSKAGLTTTCCHIE